MRQSLRLVIKLYMYVIWPGGTRHLCNSALCKCQNLIPSGATAIIA